jgi:GNAT superfamily N-acetyltransferase
LADVSRHPAPASGPSEPVPITSQHDTSRFKSGKVSLDDWLRDLALESEGRSARTYVACAKDQSVVGYYCISTGSVERSGLASKMKRARGLPNQVPVAIIGRLARDETCAGRGLGKDLLQDALRRILAASRIIGVRAVLVHALGDEAAKFWRDHEFIESPIRSGAFYLPIETIADAI